MPSALTAPAPINQPGIHLDATGHADMAETYAQLAGAAFEGREAALNACAGHCPQPRGYGR